MKKLKWEKGRQKATLFSLPTAPSYSLCGTVLPPCWTFAGHIFIFFITSRHSWNIWLVECLGSPVQSYLKASISHPIYVPPLLHPTCQLETHSGPDAWNEGRWDGFFTLCPLLLLLFSFTSFPLSRPVSDPLELGSGDEQSETVPHLALLVCSYHSMWAFCVSEAPMWGVAFVGPSHISPCAGLWHGNIPSSPLDSDPSTQTFSRGAPSLQTLLLGKFLLISSHITYFLWVHIWPVGKKIFEPGDFGNAGHYQWSPLCSAAPTTAHSPLSTGFSREVSRSLSVSISRGYISSFPSGYMKPFPHWCEVEGKHPCALSCLGDTPGESHDQLLLCCLELADRIMGQKQVWVYLFLSPA